MTCESMNCNNEATRLNVVLPDENINIVDPCTHNACDEQHEQAFGKPVDGTGQRQGTELELWRRIHDLVGNDHQEVKKIAEQQIQRWEAASLDLWEILIPVATNEGVPFPEDHHEAFRQIIMGIRGNNGTTRIPACDGDWNDEKTGKVYAEKVIPMRFRACRADAERMAAHALKYYKQREIMAYRIAPEGDIISARAES